MTIRKDVRYIPIDSVMIISKILYKVAKNLVLAGVKSLKMVDSENLREEDATSQFLAPRDKVSLQIGFRSRPSFGAAPASEDIF